jgi:crossover junction endodeoxyribonuclease RusA
MIYNLSVPPSANKLFANVPGKGRVKASAYRKWIKGELLALVAQRAKPVIGRASVAITLPTGTRGDADNRIKPTLDLLVRAGVLADDGAKHVGSVSITFGKVTLMQVEVLPMQVAA